MSHHWHTFQWLSLPPASSNVTTATTGPLQCGLGAECMLHFRSLPGATSSMAVMMDFTAEVYERRPLLRPLRA